MMVMCDASDTIEYDRRTLELSNASLNTNEDNDDIKI